MRVAKAGMSTISTSHAPRRRVAARRASLLALTAVVAALALPSASPGHATTRDMHEHAGTPAVHVRTARQLAFHDAMRKLWEDHITWTRLAIVDFAAGSPSLQSTEDRLLANQVDIGNAVAPYYGRAAGARLTALLKDHILGAVAVLQAAKAGDAARLSQANAAWYANANEIADFLAAANPKRWPKAEMREMMKEHLDATLAEATATLQGRYADSVRAYDDVHRQILEMADMLSDGIMRQFPRRFR